MKHLTFLFLLAAITLCHASSALAHLHPQLQRFVQRDPKEYLDGPNLHQAYSGKPIGVLDPTGNAAKQCPPGECSEAKPGYAPAANGCGADGWKGKLVPENPLGIAKFKIPCDGHDLCYGTCNKTKAFCDEDFRVTMRAWCALDMDNSYGHVPTAAELAKYEACLALAETYAAAVRKAGESFHTAGQEDACVCVKCKTACGNSPGEPPVAGARPATANAAGAQMPALPASDLPR